MSAKSFLAVAVAAVVLGGTAAPSLAQSSPTPSPTPTASAPVTIPDTPAGTQLRWVLDAIPRAPLTESELKAHLTPAYYAQVPPDQINQVFQSLAGLTLISVSDARPTEIEAKAAAGSNEFTISLSVDGTGKISGLLFKPITPPKPVPTGWAEIDRRLAAVAPQTGFMAAEITGNSCRTVHAVAPGKARPLGSMFKLYVLGTVAKQIRDGRLSWDTKLTITPELKSLPSGELQNRPDGSKVTVFEAAKLMISISDNTATDLLIDRVGRGAVEKTVRAWGGQAARNTPFLMTREFFVLKGSDYPARAKAYLALDAAERRAYLKNTVPKVPLNSIKAWPEPREIETIEWFGTPADICRAHARLRAFNDPKVGRAMSIDDVGMGRPAWYKGGSEPGVLDLSYSMRSGGRTFFVTTMAADPSKAFNQDETGAELIALSQGAFNLLRRS